MSRGEVLQGRVRDVTHAGEAVVETAQGIVFTRGALPDERVELRLERRVRGVWHGELIALTEASPSRVSAPCPWVERCGGCPLMTLDDRAERSWKLARLARVLGRVGAAAPPELRASPRALEYRTRTRLAFARAGGQVRLGYRAAASNEIVDIERCAVLAPPLAHALQALRERLAPELQGTGEITLALGAGELAVVVVSSASRQPRAVHDVARELHARKLVAGFELRGDPRSERQERGSGVSIGDVRQYTPHPSGTPLRAPATSFAQANGALNLELVRCVAELAQPERARAIELYAGHGNLTLALASAASLVAVEGDADAADALRMQLAERGFKHVEVRCADAAAGVRGGSPVDVAVLDPPRSGARAAIPALLKRKPSRIVYVSCDLATLERDLRMLTDAGYLIDRALAFDMFPQTAHLESVVRLQRAAPEAEPGSRA